ncbi:hypothetical protein BG006_001592 [Podila minutissima]|uniref:Rhomboid protein n=1 Tax=Podila minutissima TaxID=64525 RepID=A0A9P5SCB7_9FUNG|nr:hypothetical protein BG006_001592 [Podila minutissima]
MTSSSSSGLSSWKSTFTNVPPLTKSISTGMTVMSSLGFALRFRDLTSESDAEGTLTQLLAMVPVSAPYHPWTFATAPFYERSVLQACIFIINSAILLGCGKYLERAWGSREFFKYLAVTCVGSMLALYITCLFEYTVRGNEDLLYGTTAYGMTCVLAGFLVGFKQLVPEHLVTLWGVFSVRVKNLPIIFASYLIIEALVTRSQVQLLMAVYGMLISWVYSRFFKVQDGIRGDRSETFSFASFFPEAVQPPVKTLSNIVFGILVRLKVCSPLGFGNTLSNDLENPQMSGMILPLSQPASLRAEAERRRALALKALDMRLHAAAGNSASLPGLSRQTFLGPTPSASGIPSIPSTSTPTPPSNNENDVLFETDALDDDETSTPGPAPVEKP